MPEAVRLVIWDLDETFWKGTLTEGGIKDYVQAHHDIIIELARRGIISSICSKNDEAPVLNILQDKGILDYIVFPSISWEAKGPRLAALIETIQLRAGTVMFIDDNPGNRAEAAAMVPDLQVEDETFIARMLEDPRFVGKNDNDLKRLAQYKLLETKKKDQIRASGNNDEFLSLCNIRVQIEYDVERHLDRAIELINRTNQLNFTKKRLSEDIELAREELRKDMNRGYHKCGLVRVVDNYGDYGFVGFFMLVTGFFDRTKGKRSQTLKHYCFSCRTLGMKVEHWLYDELGRPEISVSGDVLTDISKPANVDWIRLVQVMSNEDVTLARLAPEIRLHGGCEAVSIGHYLNGHCGNLVVTGNYNAGAHFVRVNGASLLLSACGRFDERFRREAKALRIPYEMLTNKYFMDPPEGTVFVFGGQYDCPGPHRYRHRLYGWEIRIEQQNLGNIDLVNISDQELSERLEKLDESPERQEEVRAVSWHIHDYYESIPHPTDEQVTATTREIFDRIPAGSKLVVILDDDRVRFDKDSVSPAPWNTHYANLIRSLAANYPFVATVCFSNYVRDDEEIHIGGNHYARMVYYRMAMGIISAIQRLPPKPKHLAAVAA